MVLGDLGATVVKIERPGSGDDTRSWGPPHDSAGEATYFLAANRNKVSHVSDLTDAADVRSVTALCESADVVVENFRPGVMDRLGLGYGHLEAINPRLVYCSVTGFGRAGGAELAGYDLLVQALGGLMSITGEPDGGPQKVGVALVDVLTGLFATIGILAALRYRIDSGRGQHVEVNLLSCLLASLVNQGSAYTAGGVTPTRMGNEHPSIAPYEVIPTAEGDLVLAVGNELQFARLCEAIGVPRLALDSRFETNTDRVAHREVLRVELERALAGRSAPVWVATLNAAGIPAGVVNDVAGAFQLAAELGLQPIVSTFREDGTRVNLTRSPIGMSSTPPTYRLAPPRLGENSLAGRSHGAASALQTTSPLEGEPL